jgi:hypothetical protein
MRVCNIVWPASKISTTIRWTVFVVCGGYI